ncbi:MAG: hypothetical protein LC808_12685 [Actinobacteria bacterium]|nr:hypothetical protein [Actinomycetota bacterium]
MTKNRDGIVSSSLGDTYLTSRAREKVALPNAVEAVGDSIDAAIVLARVGGECVLQRRPVDLLAEEFLACPMNLACAHGAPSPLNDEHDRLDQRTLLIMNVGEGVDFMREPA